MAASPINPETGQRLSPAQLIDRLESRAGVSVARIQAKGVDLAAALVPPRDPSLISQWKSGSGPIAYVHEIISAWERAGHDTTPIIAGLVETQMEARGSEALCIDAYQREETAASARENEAQMAFVTTKEPGAWARWKAAAAEYSVVLARGLRLTGGAR